MVAAAEVAGGETNSDLDNPSGGNGKSEASCGFNVYIIPINSFMFTLVVCCWATFGSQAHLL